MSEIIPPQPAPVKSAPIESAPPPSPAAEPFVPNPSDTALLWLMVGIAALFVGYLIVDAVLQWMRRRRSERQRRERVTQTWAEMAEVPSAVRPLNGQKTTEPPPPR